MTEYAKTPQERLCYLLGFYAAKAWEECDIVVAGSVQNDLEWLAESMNPVESTREIAQVEGDNQDG